MTPFHSSSRLRYTLVLPFLVCLISLGIVGCDSQDSSGILTEVRDSAGVTIVENSGEFSRGAGGWIAGPEPDLSIGTFQGDSVYQLFQVAGATRLADGRIAVANSGSGEVRFFDSRGDYLGAVGRKGEGPGEFQTLALVGAVGGDTLVVVDNQLRRISLIHPDHGVLESARVSDDLGGGGYPQGMFADRTLVLGGGFYFSSSSGAELSNGFSRRPTNYLSTDLEGEVVTDFGEFPGSEFFMQVQNQGGGAITMRARLIPFGKHAMQAVGPHRFYYASGDSWQIEAYDPAGVLRTIFRVDREPVPVTDGDLAAVIQDEIDDVGDPAQAPEIRAGYEEMPIPDFFPAFAGIDADLHGFLWVERYLSPGDDIPVFDVLTPDGALTGQVTLPPGSEILEIGEDYILVRSRDDLDVEYVQMFSLQRPEKGF